MSRIVITVICAAALARALAAAPAGRVLLSFESAADMQAVRPARARAAQAAEHATAGTRALKVEFEENGRLDLQPESPWDARPFGALAFDLTNPSAQPLAFTVEMEDAGGVKTVARAALPLHAGESASFALPFNSAAPLAMGMRGEPGLPGLRLLNADHKPVDAAAIKIIRMWLGKPQTVFLDNVRLVPGVSYDKIVDRWGQYARGEWPGKLHSDADFRARAAEEAAELKLRPSLPDRDEFGGWASGPKVEATGFFRTLKRDGRWWLVTPMGHLFFSLGIDCVTAIEGGTVTEGRERMFEWLPAAGEAAAHRSMSRRGGPVGLAGIQLNSGATLNFYSLNLERKYGPAWFERWREVTLARMLSWGFNTVANWSDPRVNEKPRVPYTVTLGVRGETAEVSSGSDYWRRMFDVFDPRFADNVERSVRVAAERTRNDPWCLGYFVDNELPWGGMRNDRMRYGLALGSLSKGAESPAKRALVERLQARYGEISKFNAAWKTSADSWQALLERPFQPDAEFTEAMRADLAAFMKEFAARYFRTIRDALRRYDPNHLYLGARFAAHTLEELQAAAEYTDVISFNIYRRNVTPAQWVSQPLLEGIDKPVIIGEFHMGALDRGMFHTGLVATYDQADRAAAYKEYVRSVADHPAFVGCHFFKYTDEPLTGRPGDGENYNIGFTTVTDTVYPEMAVAAREVHAEVYRRRSQGTAAR